MRNNSGEILRAVAAGESVQVTNNGQVAAVISPPSGDSVSEMVARGHARAARAPLSSLSALLHTELHCAAGRHPEDVDLTSVTAVLDVVTLVDLTRGDLLTAGSLPGRIRSADALHLAAALRVGADEMITDDQALADAATVAGIMVTAP